jgi:hypothetical protein
MSRQFHPLFEFLLNAFDASELRQFVWEAFPELVTALPGKASRNELTRSFVETLSRRGGVDEALFAALLSARPRLAEDIEQLRRVMTGQETAATIGAGVRAADRMINGSGERRVRVMFVAANPVALDKLSLSEEARRIEERLRGTPGERRIEFRWRWHADAEGLIDALHLGIPDVLHFAGHGTKDGSLLLQTAEGAPHPLTPAALAALLAARQERPRVVVLNACYSVIMAQALLPLADAVIGMRDAVEDAAARTFAVEFYKAIGHGRPLQEAFELARASLLVYGLGNDDLPQLEARGCDPRTYRLI